MIAMSTKVIQALDYVFSYASDVDDFLVIKKEMLKVLPPDERSAFSNRHPLTKRQQTNDFERQLAARWSEMSGRPVLFRDDAT